MGRMVIQGNCSYEKKAREVVEISGKELRIDDVPLNRNRQWLLVEYQTHNLKRFTASNERPHLHQLLANLRCSL